MSTPTNSYISASIRGSWEDLLDRAQKLAAKHNDEAIKIYNKLISRLLKMTDDQRAANNDRLQDILIQAVVNLQAYYNIRERFDEAANILLSLRDTVPEEERSGLDAHRAQILVMDGKIDEAIELMRKVAKSPEGELPDLGAIARLYIEQNQLDKAAEMIEEMAEKEAASGKAASEEDRARDQGYIENIRSILALERGNSEEAITLFEKAMAVSPFYAENTHLLYIRLIHNGLYEEALPYIKQDTKLRLRPSFWHGLALHHLGETKEAARLWKRATEIELNEKEATSFMELILSFYYLGDKERLGLELLLRLLNETRNPGWSVFFLLGLGWAIHNNMPNAITNFDMALQQRRVSAEGTEFPVEVKTFVRDLLDEEMQSQLTSYFGSS